MSKPKEYKHKIVFSFNPYRKKKGLKKSQKPITRSKYAQYLFDKGAGWNEQKTDRTDFKRL